MPVISIVVGSAACSTVPDNVNARSTNFSFQLDLDAFADPLSRQRDGAGHAFPGLFQHERGGNDMVAQQSHVPGSSDSRRPAAANSAKASDATANFMGAPLRGADAGLTAPLQRCTARAMNRP